MVGGAWQDLARRAWEPGAKGLARWLSGAALPQSWLYTGIVAGRARAYGSGRKVSNLAPMPVISVGNLAAGGTGKTPLTLHLAQGLINRGLKPAVLTRGYGGKAGEGPLVVTPGMDPALTGDEPLEMAALSGLTVIAGSNRSAGAELAAEMGADVCLLDDGFQHLRLARDLNIALLDAAHPFGNRRCLPAGPLREPVAALHRADLFILTRAHAGDVAAVRAELESRFPGRPVLAARHTVTELTDGQGRSMDIRDKAVLVAAGVARPDEVARSVETLGPHSVFLAPFEDHQPYGPAEVEAINRRLEETGSEVIATTAKDWVKLQAWTGALNAPVGVARLSLTINGADTLWRSVDRAVDRRGAVPGVWRRTRQPLPRQGRMLIRLPNWIGDAVMAAPVIDNLKTALPGWSLSILGTPWTAPLFAAHPDIDQVVVYDRDGAHSGLAGRRKLAAELRGGFQAGLLLPNSFDSALVYRLAALPRRIGYARDGRSLLLTDPVPITAPLKTGHHLEYYLGLLTHLGLSTAVRTPRLHLAGEDHEWAQSWLDDHLPDSDTPLIGLAPGAAFGPAKQWPEEYFTRAAAGLISQTNGRAVVFGSKADADLGNRIAASAGAGVINMAGQSTLGQAAALIARTGLMITNDSGLMHLAAAVDAPLVAVFGPTDHIRTGPRGTRQKILTAGPDCAPCLEKQCPKGRTCLHDINPERVIETGMKLLEVE